MITKQLVEQYFSTTQISGLENQIETKILCNKTYEEVKTECSPLVHSFYCRNTWAPHEGTYFYRCKTCQLSDNSCICVDCFKNGNHEGHDYILQRSVYGGTCDCGRMNSWKKEGMCSCHGKQFDGDLNEIMPEPFKSYYVENMKVIYQCIAEKLQEIYLDTTGNDEHINNLIYKLNVLLKVIIKIQQIDLFYLLNTNIMNELKVNNVFVSNKTFSTLNIVQMMIECSFYEKFDSLTEMPSLLYDMCQSHKFITENINFYFYIHTEIIIQNSHVSDIGMNFNEMMTCQFYSDANAAQKYIFDNEANMMRLFDMIEAGINLQINQPTDFENSLNNFVFFFSGYLVLSKHNNNRMFSAKKYFHRFIEVFEKIMFYKQTLRLKTPNEYDDETEKTVFSLKEFISLFSEPLIERMTQEELKEQIIYVYERILHCIKENNQKYNINEIKEIDVGINQPVTAHLPLVWILGKMFSVIENPIEILNQMPEIDWIVSQIVIYYEFVSEESDRLWLANMSSSENKLIHYLPTFMSVHVFYKYILQLASKNQEQLLQTLKAICKVEKQIGFNCESNRELIKQQIDEKEKDRIETENKELIASGFALFKLIVNMFLSPMSSSHLTEEDQCLYINIHTCADLNGLQKLDLDTFLSMDMSGSIKQKQIAERFIERKMNRFHLKEEMWKYINPYCDYCFLSHDDVYENYIKKIGVEKPLIFNFSQRDTTLHSSVLKILHSQEVTEWCIHYLSLFDSIKLINIILYILLLRFHYQSEEIIYSEEHQHLLKKLGELIAKFREWKEVQIIQECKGTVFDSIYQGYLTVKGEDKVQQKSTKKLSKKEKMLQMMKKKREQFQQNREDESEDDGEIYEDEEEKEPCILCMDTFNSEEKGILGYMAHIESGEIISLSEHYDADETARGMMNGDEWIKPYAFEHGEVKWNSLEENIILENKK